MSNTNPKQFFAENYLTRKDLEDEIMASVGADLSKNREIGHEIVGERKILKKLFLTDKNSIWGIKVRITDFPTSELLKQKKLEMEAKDKEPIKKKKKKK